MFIVVWLRRNPFEFYYKAPTILRNVSFVLLYQYDNSFIIKNIKVNIELQDAPGVSKCKRINEMK